MKTVVAALIKKDGKYLLAKRSTGNPDLIGFWEFPGGKIEKNETIINLFVETNEKALKNSAAYYASSASSSSSITY